MLSFTTHATIPRSLLQTDDSLFCDRYFLHFVVVMWMEAVSFLSHSLQIWIFEAKSGKLLFLLLFFSCVKARRSFLKAAVVVVNSRIRHCHLHTQMATKAQQPITKTCNLIYPYLYSCYIKLGTWRFVCHLMDNLKRQLVLHVNETNNILYSYTLPFCSCEQNTIYRIFVLVSKKQTHIVLTIY